MYNPHTKPYWNADVKQAHTKERNMRRVWMQDGRPRGMQHESYFNYKRAKRDFRNIQKLANEQYIEETYDDINNAAECDIRLFWKLIKRQKPKHSKVCQQIKHNNIVHTSPESICNAFANYFEDLYTPADTSTFDDPTLNEMNKAYREIERVCKADEDLYLPGGMISCNDVSSVIKQLKRRKACGNDMIQNEHLIYGGPKVSECLSIFLNIVVEKQQVPSDWQKGLVVPLFKGGDKSKLSPDSYRPVCLLSSVLKLFEKIVLIRLQTFVVLPETFPNPLQHGFQKGLGCLTASFCLLETIYHNIEQNSKVFVAFLDSRKAFDTVWRKALMFKLFNLGVKGKAWSLINDMYSKTQGSVVVNKCKSNNFVVKEGVRQGGVLSGFLYLVFINELINELERCNRVTGVNSIKCCAPSLADDITCIATTPQRLQHMLDICTNYSNKWRFQFNGKKSCVIQFSKSSIKTDYNWKINQESVPG
ncbi:Hypothetical predicted protein [Mytilus galloprovincialis]|uniref:Reverse transcriptase domain-containing protein n=1 Tax=Mytilus galloprovincialis TaxID=29158 RepID=A0A8B6DTY0_MYTGA|nr:Hypothetical predicted protein [Mytilus galloprovincialis]